MKIIKEGKKLVHRAHCKWCGCEFELMYSECKSEAIPVGAIRLSSMCPNASCLRSAVVNQESESEDDKKIIVNEHPEITRLYEEIQAYKALTATDDIMKRGAIGFLDMRRTMPRIAQTGPTPTKV